MEENQNNTNGLTAEYRERKTNTSQGIKRLPFFLLSLLVSAISIFCLYLFQNSSLVIGILPIIYYPAMIWLVVLRLRNIGSSPWYSGLYLIPVINLAVVIPCLAFPQSYSQTKKIDHPGLAVISLCVAMIVFSIIASGAK